MRAATKDVVAIFESAALIRELAAKIAEEEKPPPDWLNDAAKGFLPPGYMRGEALSLTHLLVRAPEPRHMLAMRCISARWDTSDRDDVIFLLRLLRLLKPKEVFDLIEGYCPKKPIPADTKFLIEEVLEK